MTRYERLREAIAFTSMVCFAVVMILLLVALSGQVCRP